MRRGVEGRAGDIVGGGPVGGGSGAAGTVKGISHSGRTGSAQWCSFERKGRKLSRGGLRRTHYREGQDVGYSRNVRLECFEVDVGVAASETQKALEHYTMQSSRVQVDTATDWDHRTRKVRIDE